MRRLAALFFSMLMWCSGAAASFAPTAGYEYIGGTMSAWVFGGTQACTALAAAWNVSYSASLGYTVSYGSFTHPGPCYVNKSNGGTLNYSMQNRSASQCPANSTLSGGQCTCNSGYEENSAHTACQVQQVTCNAGDVVSTGYYDGGTAVSGGPPAAACTNGCLVVFDGSFPSGNSMVAGVKHYYGLGKYVKFGSRCDSGNGTGQTGGAGTMPASSTSVPDDTCPAGQAMGTVNGKKVCADTGTGQTQTPTTTNMESETSSTTKTSNADGTSTETTTTTKKNADGTGSTTVTTTVKNPDGTVKSSTSETTGSAVDKEAEQGKCEKNAAEAGCGGDPTAPDSAQLYGKKTKTVQSVLDAAKTTLQGSPVGSAVGNFFTVSGGGSCPAATWSIPIMGRTATASMDAFCTSTALNIYLAVKLVVLLLASIWAFRIAIE